ncbi:MAG: 23S rRNA (adenine(2030)-N(6))-methyltransferase RlmJ [Proteobacteria bacterium]|nr:23S rRNA (adenine(2030)-N(6))-methyltransferase RlmJ [Pseudomonadota bacterium]
MNYRHAFHAGSFADVVKHVVLTRVLVHLAAKPAALRVIDTHAGAGIYDLTGRDAAKTGEWRHGIGRVARAAILAEAPRALLRPYLDAVAAYNRDGTLAHYPGSPLIAVSLLRRRDRLIACEIVPGCVRSLKRALGRDARAKVVEIDGWRALKAFLPPRERRGLVLIDPPFEEADAFALLGRHLAEAGRKWPTGIYIAWYPIKDRVGPDALARMIKRSGLAHVLRAELQVRAANDERLSGSGLLVVNPPWTLENELGLLFPALADLLGDGDHPYRLDWIAREM